MNEPVDAAILAAGVLPDADGAEIYTATLTIGGETLLERVTKALDQAEQVQQIMAVVPGELVGSEAAAGLDAAIERGVDIHANLRLMAEWLEGRERALVVGVDLPLLTADVVSDFLNRIPDDADLAYPIVRREDVERAFPDADWTYVRTADGELTGGTLGFLRPALLERMMPLLDRAFDVRKNMAGLAAMLGFRFVLKLVTGRARIEEVERRAREITGGRCVALMTDRPEIALDVDEWEHLEMARRLLGVGEAGEV